MPELRIFIGRGFKVRLTKQPSTIHGLLRIKQGFSILQLRGTLERSYLFKLN